jgi:N-succinyldiaminopimelate aminotransferase
MVAVDVSASRYKAERVGSTAATIFAEMSALALTTDSVNLGQGFPDYDGPDFMLAAAERAIAEGVNQYPPGRGIAPLRQAVVDHSRRHYGLDYDAEREVIITTGATEALAAAVLAFVDPGDEVIALEPFYDSYAASVALAGGRIVGVGVFGPDFALDLDELHAAVTQRSKVILVNSPHNPTGAVLGRTELEAIARLARDHDLLVICDEVYEHLVFDGVEHLPLAGFPGMRERTIRISSSGKTFSATGWKIGWALGPAQLVTELTAVKQFLTYVNGAPFQPAIATGLRLPDAFFTGIAETLAYKRDVLGAGLRNAGFDVSVPSGSYFTVADAGKVGAVDAAAFCRELPERAGVVAIPLTAFASPARRPEYATLVRFAACKRVEVLEDAASRLAVLRA